MRWVFLYSGGIFLGLLTVSLPVAFLGYLTVCNFSERKYLSEASLRDRIRYIKLFWWMKKSRTVAITAGNGLLFILFLVFAVSLFVAPRPASASPAEGGCFRGETWCWTEKGRTFRPEDLRDEVRDKFWQKEDDGRYVLKPNLSDTPAKIWEEGQEDVRLQMIGEQNIRILVSGLIALGSLLPLGIGVLDLTDSRHRHYYHPDLSLSMVPLGLAILGIGLAGIATRVTWFGAV